jgi:hypothetical protein
VTSISRKRHAIRTPNSPGRGSGSKAGPTVEAPNAAPPDTIAGERDGEGPWTLSETYRIDIETLPLDVPDIIV